MVPEVSGIILAGGASRRMGHNKAWLDVGGVPVIERVLQVLRNVVSEIIIVTNEFSQFELLNVRLAKDIHPGTGSLGGLFSGLQSASFQYAAVVGCDMPFLNEELLEFMRSLTAGHDIVIPSVPNDRKSTSTTVSISGLETAKKANLHPLHAFYSKICLDPIEQAIRREDLRMISFHDGLKLRIVSSNEVEAYDPEHLSLLNLNTPEDLEYARKVVTQEENTGSGSIGPI